jgi:hypothetical protein
MLATIDTLELTTTQAEALFDAGYCAWNDSPEPRSFMAE